MNWWTWLLLLAGVISWGVETGSNMVGWLLEGDPKRSPAFYRAMSYVYACARGGRIAFLTGGGVAFLLSRLPA